MPKFRTDAKACAIHRRGKMMKKRVFVLAAVLALIATLLTLSAFAADNVRYVANTVMGTGDGLSAENATTLDKAFGDLNTNVFTKAEHAGETCTIYLVEDIELMPYKPEGTASPRLAAVFSEDAHADNAVAISTMPGKAKATVTFPYGSSTATRVYNYLLSGETSFDNVIFTTTVKGSIQVPVIAAQGHKLTLGKDVEVVKQDGCHGVAVVGFTFTTNTLRTNQSENVTKVIDADVTVLGGEYEYITAFSYNTAVAAGSAAKLTLGNVKVGTLSATNFFAGTVNKDVAVDVVYTGKVEADAFWPTRRPADGNVANGGTFSHTLKKGASLSYTEMNVTKAGNATLNILFDPTDTSVTQQAKALYDALHDDANIGTFNFSTVTSGTPCADGAHKKTTAFLTEATCAEGALSFDYCSVCGKMLSDIYAGEPDESKHTIAGAAWTLSDDGKQYVKKCVNCGKVAETYPVTDGKVAVYVSANGTANGGESQANPVDTLRGAQELAAKLAETYYGADDTETPVTIYVIGRVDMPSRLLDASGNIVGGNKVSSGDLNKFTQCFEETPHIDHPFLFTSLAGAERGLLNFFVMDTYSPTTMSARNMTYMLYGPTTFENLSFGAAGGTYNGVTYTARMGHTIAARGFKLVLGEGITMIDNKGKLNSANQYSTKESDFRTSDIKLYVVGGFYASGATHANFAERKDSDPYDADITVLSGEYWFVGALNRSVTAVEDTTSTLTLGSPKITFLSDISTGNTALHNVRVDVFYKGAVAVRTHYLGTQNKHDGSGNGGYGNGGYTVNHVLYPASAGMSTVAFSATYRDVLNVYYFNGAEGKAEELAKSRNVDKLTFVADYCFDWRGGHTAGADGKCTFCGVTVCTGDHDFSGFTYVTEATCTKLATGYHYCVNCYARQAIISVGDKDPNNHDYQMMTDGTLKCSRCDHVLSVSEPIVYVTNIAHTGTQDGKTAKTPLTRYNDAYMLAVAAARALGSDTATVYLVGGVTIDLDFAEGTYLEPEHTDIEVTVKGYGKGLAEFIFSDAASQRVEYGLNGPTVFDNVEIGSTGTNQLYFSARHNHITMGKQVSMNFRRNSGGGDAHSAAVTVLGGCYSTKFGDCDGMDAHVTLYSGIYRNIIGGSASRNCGLESGKITLEILGDISTRESIYGGSSGGDVGDVDVIIGGNAVSAEYLTFGSSNGRNAKNVRVFLKSGTLSSGSFGDTNRLRITPIGSASSTGSILANKSSLVVYYDPSEPSSKEMMRMIRSSAIDGDKVRFELLDSLCTASADGKHTHASGAAPIESATATCYTDGYEIYECTACHKQYTVSTGKAQHTFGSATTIAPTCKDYGMTAETCTICGFTQYTVDENAAPDKDNHHLENGVCTICHYSAAADCDHVFGASLVTESSKCGTTVYRVCEKCGLREVVSTTGNHNWGVYTVTVEPTDTTPGTKTRKCKTCGKVETALLYPNDTSIATDPIAVDASGNAVGFAIENSKLTKAEKAALNALLQDTAYGSEVKVSYTTDGTTVTNVTYSIPVPDEYKDYENVKIVVKDDEGNLHAVDFKIEKGYFVFTF